MTKDEKKALSNALLSWRDVVERRYLQDSKLEDFISERQRLFNRHRDSMREEFGLEDLSVDISDLITF